MSLAKSSVFRKSNFEDFLFSELGIQSNGLPLTVLSLFARAGVDPWDEAERLSEMSNIAAVSYMMSEIKRAPALCRSNADVAQLAKSLVARLPAHDAVKPINASIVPAGFERLPMIVVTVMVFCAIFAFGVLVLALARG